VGNNTKLMKSIQMEMIMLTKYECLGCALCSIFFVMLTVVAMSWHMIFVAIAFTFCAMLCAFLPLILETWEDDA